MKHIIIIFFISISHFHSFSQRPPESFFNGLDNIATDPAKAKQFFYQALAEDSTFYGTHNFLGILLSQEKKYDSAIKFLTTSIRLNTNNSNHTKEMTLERLCRTYLRAEDFENSYKTALTSVREFPDNQYLAYELKELCLWAYNIKYGGLSKEYLQPEVKNEYLVNSVSQEYLIMRNITIKNMNLQFGGQSFDGKKNIDILHCFIRGTKDSIDLIFKLGWNVLKSFGDNMPDYKVVYQDKQNKIWYRLGAILSNDSKIDLLKEIAKLDQ